MIGFNPILKEQTMTSGEAGRELLTPGEVAAMFRVDAKTVTRWAAAGRVGSVRTPGGHRRYHAAEIRALLEAPGDAKAGD
jgi:excisionase family DNA binding protein